jgi:hypothetical protein
MVVVCNVNQRQEALIFCDSKRKVGKEKSELVK